MQGLNGIYFLPERVIPLPLGRQNDTTSPIFSEIWTLTQTKINFRYQLTSLRFSQIWNIEMDFCLSRFLMFSNMQFLYTFRLSSWYAANYPYSLKPRHTAIHIRKDYNQIYFWGNVIMRLVRLQVLMIIYGEDRLADCAKRLWDLSQWSPILCKG